MINRCNCNYFLYSVFCFLFVEKSKSYFFTQLALIFTVFADLFLVWFGAEDQLSGMIFFFGTQMSYFLRIFLEESNPKTRKIHLIVRISASILISFATCVVLGENTDAVAIISLLYFANLAINTIFAFVNFKRSPLLAIGLTFFVLCDIFVGIATMGAYIHIAEGSLAYKILNSGVNWAWIFYVPSQTLLAISLFPTNIKKRV